MGTSPLTLDHVIIPKIRGTAILDVGCGCGKWGFLVKKYFWSSQNGSTMSEPFVVGVDRYFPLLPELNRHRIYDLLIHADATALPFQDKSFDTVLAIELIEHLTKANGLQAFKEFERIARRCIILSTPNRKCLRDGIETLNGFNKYEAHLSWWQIRDLQSLGYRCFGLGVKLPPRRLWNMTEFSYFSYRVPMIAETLMCVKVLS